MKNSLNYMFQNFKYSLDTQKFKLAFIFSLIASVYGVFTLAFRENYVTGFANILNGSFYVLLMVLIILINTLNTYYIYSNNNFYIMRCLNRKQYLINIIKGACFNNLIIIIINFMLVMIGLNCFNNNINLSDVSLFGTHSFIYLIFMIIKFVILLEIITLINILLLSILDNKLVIIINLIFCMFIVVMPYSPNVLIDSVIKLPLFLGEYFFYHKYSGFIFEILCFIIYISIIMLIVRFLFLFVNKKLKKIGV